MHLVKHVFRERANEGQRVLPQQAAREEDLEVGAGQFAGDVHSVRYDGQVRKPLECPRNSRGRRTGIKRDTLPLLNEIGRSRSDTQLLLRMAITSDTPGQAPPDLPKWILDRYNTIGTGKPVLKRWFRPSCQ